MKSSNGGIAWTPATRNTQKFIFALTELAQGQMATVVYYGSYEQAYKQLTGAVKKVDSFCKTIQIGEITIDFSEISELYAM